MNELDQIKEQMDDLLKRNDHWKSCQDGSYEMALDLSGYYKLKKQYNELLKQQEA